MFRTQLQLSPLEARKQLLLVESEVNRAQLAAECADLAEQLQVLGGKLHPLLSAGTSIISGFRVLRGIGSENLGKNGSWLSTVIDAIRSGVSVWSAIKSRPR